MQNPPGDSRGYRFASASIVDWYMSPSRRITRPRRSATLGSVSLNQPSRNTHLRVEQPVEAEVLLDLPPARRRGSGCSWCAVASVRRILRRVGRRQPPNESATNTRASRTPCAARTARMRMQAPPRQTPVSIRSPGTPFASAFSMQYCRLSSRACRSWCGRASASRRPLALLLRVVDVAEQLHTRRPTTTPRCESARRSGGRRS